jgi:phosphatidate cytidylyltransferase
MLTRIISAIIGGPVLLAFILWTGGPQPFPGWPFALLVLGLTFQALRELYDGCRTGGYSPRDAVGYLGVALFWLAATPLLDHQFLHLGLTLLLMASLTWEALRRDRKPLKALPATWFGAFYVGWLFPFAARLRIETPPAAFGWEAPAWGAFAGAGAWLVLFVLLVTSAVDTGAYLVGKSLGKHKLAPEISPGKTWEGSIGGFAAGVVVAAALGLLLHLPLAFALAAGVLIGLVSQLGDLSKSAIKREIGIKDFGTLIPGHGGVLDRFDSLLFTAPAVYWLIAFWRP